MVDKMRRQDLRVIRGNKKRAVPSGGAAAPLGGEAMAW